MRRPRPDGPKATPASRKPSTGTDAQAEKQRRDDPRRHEEEQRLLIDAEVDGGVQAQVRQAFETIRQNSA